MAFEFRRIRPKFRVAAVLAVVLVVLASFGTSTPAVAEESRPVPATQTEEPQSSCAGQVEITGIRTFRSEVPAGGTIGIEVAPEIFRTSDSLRSVDLGLSITDSDGNVHYDPPTRNVVSSRDLRYYYWQTQSNQKLGQYFIEASVSSPSGEVCHTFPDPVPGASLLGVNSFLVVPAPNATDLGIQALAPPTGLIMGEEMNIEFVALNNSDSHTGPFNVDVFLRKFVGGREIPADFGWPTDILTRGTEITVAPGGDDIQRAAKAEVPGSPQITTGEYSLCMRIDYIDPVDDLDETNDSDCVRSYVLPDIAELSLRPISFPDLNVPLIDDLPRLELWGIDFNRVTNLYDKGVSAACSNKLDTHLGLDVPQFWVSVPEDIFPSEKAARVVSISKICSRSQREGIYRALLNELSIRHALKPYTHTGVFDILSTGSETVGATAEFSDFLATGIEVTWNIAEVGAEHLGGVHLTQVIPNQEAIGHAAGPVLAGISLTASEADALFSAAGDHGIHLESALISLNNLEGALNDPAWARAIVLANQDLNELTSEDFWTRYFAEQKRRFADLTEKRIKFAVAVAIVAAGGTIAGAPAAPIVFAVGVGLEAIDAFYEQYDHFATMMAASHLYGTIYDPDATGIDLEIQKYAKYMIYDHAYKATIDNWLVWLDARILPFMSDWQDFESVKRDLGSLRQVALDEAIETVILDKVELVPLSSSLSVGDKARLRPVMTLGSGRTISVSQATFDEGIASMAVDWSIAPRYSSIATITQDGEITAVGPGTAPVCATAGHREITRSNCVSVTVERATSPVGPFVDCIQSLGTLTEVVILTGQWTGGCASTHRAGSYARFYSFTLAEEKDVVINLDSSVDTFLYLLRGADSGGQTVQFNDNVQPGISTNSGITRKLSAGTYTIEATTQRSATMGSFTLTIIPEVTTNSQGLDLWVEPPTLTPSSLAVEDHLTLSVTVRYQGTGAAAPATLRYYRSTDSTISRADTPVGGDTVTGLGSNVPSDQQIGLVAPSAGGTYYYGACVDPVPGESNLQNNCSTHAALTVTEAQPAPDLAVYSPSVYDASPHPGEVFSMGFQVRNEGDGASMENASLRYYRSSDSIISPSDAEITIRTGTTRVSPIAPSGRSIVTVSLTAHSSGTYYYGACVDTVPNETNTWNNCAAVFKISTRAPDLVLQSLSVSDNSPEPGASFTLRLRVRNQGDLGAEATTLRYYRSSDESISSSDVQVGTDPVDSLDPGRVSSQSITPNAITAAGTSFYGACVDSVAGESDTANNCSTSLAVTIAGTSQSPPDLLVQQPTVSDSNVLQGESFTLRATVQNQGVGVSEATTLRYYSSSDSTITSSDTAIGTDDVTSLAANGRSAESISVTAPSIFLDRTLYFGACADPVVGEASTENNCSSSVAVTVARPSSGVPDLRMGGITASADLLRVGTSFSLRSTVSNQGNRDGGSSNTTTLRFYLSTDSTISSADAELGTGDVGGLSFGRNQTLSIDLTAPATAGTYYYGACVEPCPGRPPRKTTAPAVRRLLCRIPPRT